MIPRILSPFRHLLLSSLLASAVAAADPGPAVFHAADGVVCLEAEHAVDLQGWEEASFYTGRGLRARTADGHADYRLEIAEPGVYRIQLLGARQYGPGGADNRVGVSLAPDGTTPAAVAQLRFRDHNAIAWTDLDRQGRAGASLTFTTPGTWHLRLTAAAGTGFFLDKLVLVRAGVDFIPTGTGPAETLSPASAVTRPGFDAGVVLPPAWAFGVLYGGYTNQAQTLDALDRLAAGDFPVDAYWIDSWFWSFQDGGRGPGGYMSFIEDKVAFPDAGAMWTEFQRRGIKAGVWVWDCILRDGNEAAFDDFDRRRFFSSVFVSRDYWHNRHGIAVCGNIDFDSPEAVAYWQQKLAPFFAAGLDFLKIDRNSNINFSRAAFAATQQLGRETRGRGFILAHLHSTHDPRHKLYPAKWSGDAKIAWSQPDYPDTSRAAMGGLQENIAIVADAKRSTYEVPFLANDTGGYDTFGDGTPTEELFVRWLQFSSLNTLTTFFSFAASPTRNHPYAYSPEAQAIGRKYLHLRMRLFPYLYTAALDTRLTGKKPVQGDGVHEYQYLLGPALLVAPVFTPATASREVHLPEGRWYDWDTDAAYAGGQAVTVAAPLAKLPLFVRAGAIVPLRNYAASIGAGTNARLTLETWPADTATTYTLREDDGTSNDYLAGGFASTELRLATRGAAAVLEIQPVQGTYASMEPDREWIVRLHDRNRPQAATLNGGPVPFTYDGDTRIVTVTLAGPKGAGHVLKVE